MQDLDAVQDFPSSLPSEFQQVDLLVNNAGLALGLEAVDTTDILDITRMMNTNVLGLMAMTTAFTKGMRARKKGHIINIGSISGHYT